MRPRPPAGQLLRAAVTSAVVVLAAAAVAAAQSPAPVPPSPSESAPFQCWWRSDAGAIRLGEGGEVALTCAAR
ncbi:MAG: hypothetical protein AB7U83_14850, partial [Vicinamibacterales bacterium]